MTEPHPDVGRLLLTSAEHRGSPLLLLAAGGVGRQGVPRQVAELIKRRGFFGYVKPGARD